MKVIIAIIAMVGFLATAVSILQSHSELLFPALPKPIVLVIALKYYRCAAIVMGTAI